MIKEIKVILERALLTGGLKFIVVEMVIPPEGGFPIEEPLQGVTIAIFQGNSTVPAIIGQTDNSGIYLEPVLPVGSYKYTISLDGWKTKQGTEIVE